MEAQARVFLAMAVLGVGLAAVYDAAALLRRALKLGRAGTGLCDLLFGAVCALGITAAALRLQVSPFRLYVFAGTALGMGLYAATMGTIVRYICRVLQKNVKKS